MTPNALVSEFRNRMPVILDPADYDRWLVRSVTNPEKVKPMLATFSAELTEAVAVSRFVGNARNEGPACRHPRSAKGPDWLAGPSA